MGRPLFLVKLSLTARILLGYVVVIVTFGAVSIFSMLTLRQNQLEMRLVSEGYLELSQTVAAIETFQTNQSKDTARLRDEQNVETRKALMRLARLYFPGLMDVRLRAGKETAQRVLEFAPEAERPFISDVARKFDELTTRFAEYEAEAERVFTMLESPNPDWAAANEGLERLQTMENQLASTIRLMHGSLEARIHERVRRTQEREQRTGVAIILLPVVALGVGLFVTAFAVRSLRPVRTLLVAVSRVRRGDYEAKIGVEGDNEIALLSREFESMAKSLKEREAQLLRAERLAAVGRVSAQVAHEIRNPLSSIGLNVEMLTDQLASTQFKTPEDAKEARDLLASVTREVDRLTEITEDYLRLARLPAPVKRPEDLGRLVEEVLGFSHEELERAGLAVTLEIAPEPLPISADEGQLRQVFLNLVRNAREAMASGGKLLVRTRAAGPMVEVEFTDTGSGMTGEVKEKLFEPFFTTKQGGTGLGLSLSRQIVEAHGGRIDVESEVGLGTTFRLGFPRL